METDLGGAIDLLCLDETGDTVIVELKRCRTPREVVAQVLGYASWVRDLSHNELTHRANDYLSDDSDEEALECAFADTFEELLPDVLNESHRMLVVASEIDARTERIIEYLSDEYGANINAVTFQLYEDGGVGELLARTFLIKPGQVARRTRQKRPSKRKPNPTFEEFRAIAEEKGESVGQWYETIETALRHHLRRRRSKKGVCFYTRHEGDNFERETGAIFNLWPTSSSKENGLYFQIYAERFAHVFGEEQECVHNLLPDDREEWQYAGIEDPEWGGYEGFFRHEEEVERFTGAVEQLARNDMSE